MTLEQDLILTFAAHGLHLDSETVQHLQSIDPSMRGFVWTIRAHPIADDVAELEREIQRGH